MAQKRASDGPEALPLLLAAQIAGLWLADSGVLPAGVARGAAIVAFAAVLSVRRRPDMRLILLTLSVGAASAGWLAARLEAAADDRARATGTRTIEGRALGLERRDDWIRFELRDSVAADGGGPVPRSLRLEGEAGAALTGLAPGERLRVRAALEPVPPQRNPGGRDLAQELARRGIGAMGRIVAPGMAVREVTGGWRLPGLERIERLRARAGARLAQAGEGGALLQTLACGERGGLSADTRRAFAELGLAHVLSVSGLHLVLVAGFAFSIGSRVLRAAAAFAPGRDLRRPGVALAAAVAAGYALFSGFEVPVQRALCMVLGGAVALARRRPVRGRSALLAAAFLVLAAAPETLFAAGAQMSFAASAALLGLRRDPLHAPDAGTRVARLVRGARELLSVSAAAGAATAPLAATHLGVLAPAGLVANLVFVPVTGLVLLPTALVAAAAAAIPAGASPPLAAVADTVVAAGASAARLTCDLVAALADALPDLPPVAAPRASVLLGCGLLALAAVRSVRLGRRVAACLASTLLLAVAPPAPIRPEPPRAVFLDVGQGDATLVQGREGALLVDAGLATPQGLDMGRHVVVPALAALGVRRLDVLAVTHADADHAGGVAAVLAAFPVDALWLPAGAAGDAAFDGLRARAAAAGVPVRLVSSATPPAHLGDLRVTPLAPAAAGPWPRGNDGSLVLQVEVARQRILLPGDLETDGEARLLRDAAGLDSSILKLGHHGSRTSTTPALLDAVSPRLAVASAACGGRFGLPHPEIVARLDATGVPWRWTGRDGAVLVGLGGPLSIRSLRSEPARCTPGVRRASGRRQRPKKRGFRFSTKACCASRASSLRRSGRPSSSWRR